MVYASIICVHQQLDLLNAFIEAAAKTGENVEFPTAFPISFSTLLHGRKFRLACVWHSQRIEVCPLIELELLNQIDLKRCFLLRHEIIKIVQAVGVMLDNISGKLVFLPPPRSDLWWQWYCCEKVTDGKYILCDRCGRWYHWECAEIEKKPSGSWYCGVCRSKPKAPQMMKGSAEPREDRGPPDSDGSPTATPSLHRIRRVFKVQLRLL